MKVLFVHPSPLMYSEIFLRLEPLGIERVAQAARLAGHEPRILDLQLYNQADYFRTLADFKPEAVGFSLNYLANAPEVLDLAAATKERLPGCFVFVGGHSASFIATELLEQSHGSVDCIVKGEGEAITARLLDACRDGNLERLPGIITTRGSGPQPLLLDSLDEHMPARDLTSRRRRYFIGELDPCASVEFTRGCPWNCSFCSAWTFYGRSYRKLSAEAAVEDLARVAEPNVFIVDDVAFIHPEHAYAIGAEIERRGIHKQYYLETRSDVLLKQPEVFAYWRKLGMRYLFLGFEALDEETLKAHRKRVSKNENFAALDLARQLGINVAINIIAEPGWDENNFRAVREWALSVPEIVHLTVNTPYPGTETWYTESRQLTSTDYRLFDIQHALVPTALPLTQFYEELVNTQAVINRKHLGWAIVPGLSKLLLSLLLQGQTNFLKGMWKFGQVYNAQKLLAEHNRPARYHITPPPQHAAAPALAQLYVHAPRRASHADSLPVRSEPVAAPLADAQIS